MGIQENEILHSNNLIMNANTVYDIFLALPESERKNLTTLVNEHQKKSDPDFFIKIKKAKPKLTKKEAIDYLLKNIFSSKK